MSNATDEGILRGLLARPKQFQLDFFLANHARIQDDSAYWQILAALWIGNGTSARIDDYLPLFRSPRRNRSRLMKKGDRRVWRDLPETVTAYRAAAPFEDLSRVFSWSLDRAVLQRLYPGRPTFVWQIPRTRILAYFDRRGEREIIVLPESIR